MFALQAGYQARLKAGAVDRYAVTGTCAGTATLSVNAATAATFEGVTGFAAPQTLTTNYTNCTLATNAVSATSYFDTNYSPLGSSIPNGTYAKFLTAPPVLPASVKVGDTAILATLTLYADNTKASVTGQRVISYVVETDTPNVATAIVNVISREFNAANQLTSTMQVRYRIAADGTLTSTTIDIQYSTTSTTHFLLTKS